MGEGATNGEPARRGGETAETEDRVSTLEAKLSTLRDALTHEMQSVWAAEGRVYEMGKKLEIARQQLAVIQIELDAQRARTEAAERRAIEAEELLEHPAGMTPELAAVFRDAGDLVARILAEADRTTEGSGTPGPAAQEFADLEAWRDRLASQVGPLREAVTEAQQEIEVVAVLIREALEPANIALTSLAAHLDTFMQAAGSSNEQAAEPSDEIVVDISAEQRSPFSSTPSGR